MYNWHCRMVRRLVELLYKTGTKMEWNVNIIKAHTVLCPFIKQTVDAIHMTMLLVERLHNLTGEPT